MPLAMLLGVIQIAGLIIVSLVGEQGDPPASPRPEDRSASQARMPALRQRAGETARSIEAEVQIDRLDVFDRPDDAAFITGRVHRGDRLRVRADHTPGTGWLAIEPLPTAIFWIDRSSLELDNDEVGDAVARDRDPAGQDPSRTPRAWVSRAQAVIRSAHPEARLPGPPRGVLPRGTMVQLVDRPPLSLGQGPEKTRWLAIAPPSDQVSYVHAKGVHWVSPTPPVPPAAEVRASYEEPMPPDQAGRQRASPPSSPSSWPPDISADLQRIDAMYRVIVASQPIEQWRFETVRAGYQDLLKRAGDRPELEEALRTRLNRLTQHEQAARAARTIESILTKSHRRDGEVAKVRRDLERLERTRARAYDAVGFIQPSARKVDGHKVFALIGREGSTIAYLDIPPGLDPEPFLARRIGVRGQVHFSEDLGARLITVRDMESIEARK
jgi:hypothetical protein